MCVQFHGANEAWDMGRFVQTDPSSRLYTSEGININESTFKFATTLIFSERNQSQVGIKWWDI